MTQPGTALVTTRRSSVEVNAMMEAVCAHFAEGTSVKEACDHFSTTHPDLWDWAHRNDRNAAIYARARALQAHALADDILPISDDAKAETAQVARLRVDSRKWLASKLAPRHYGDKLEITVPEPVTFILKRED